MSRKNVLIVEDEREIAELIRFHVEREGLSAQIIESGQAALDSIAAEAPDLLLLDLMLPDLNGLEVCKRIKYDERTRDLPIIIVSARGEESDVVTGIELGADDYVTKPFSPRILMARIKSVLRRSEAVVESEPSSNARYSIGSMQLDTDRHEVTVDKTPVVLTVTEFGILAYLASRPGFVRTRDQIIAAVHGGNTVLSSRTIDVHVTALRKKLGPAGALIETVRGVGYRLSENNTTREYDPA